MLECRFSVTLGETTIAPDFEAPPGITVLFGASGSGKTVTLRTIAGLIRPSRGRIRFEGRSFFDDAAFDGAARTWLSPSDRRVGYVPQSLALYPHMTVAQNVAFGAHGASDAHARRMLQLLDIDSLADRRPRALSGGQQQRVALARALSRADVRLLLMDEPLSSLDEALRDRLRRELLALRAELGFDALFVTHDLREAFMLADWIVLLDVGRVLQQGSRDEVFRQPLSRRVAELTGVANLVSGHLAALGPDHAEVDVGGVRWLAARPAWDTRVGEAVDVAVRAERIALRRPDAPPPGRVTNLLAAELVRDESYGSGHTLAFHPAEGVGPALEVELPARPYDVLGVAARRSWTLEVDPADVHLMRREAGG